MEFMMFEMKGEQNFLMKIGKNFSPKIMKLTIDKNIKLSHVVLLTITLIVFLGQLGRFYTHKWKKSLGNAQVN